MRKINIGTLVGLTALLFHPLGVSASTPVVMSVSERQVPVASTSNPCTDPANPNYACGWASLDGSGRVTNVHVCTFAVCGSGNFGGQRQALQTRQMAGGNVAGFNSGEYDSSTNRFYPHGPDGGWFVGGDTWENIYESLEATRTPTSTTTSTTTTIPSADEDVDVSASVTQTTTSPQRTSVSPVVRRTTTTTIEEEVVEDDGEIEEDYAELAVRQIGSRFQVTISSSLGSTAMTVRARQAGRPTITWKFTTAGSGRHRFLTTRQLSGYQLTLWIEDERMDALRIR